MSKIIFETSAFDIDNFHSDSNTCPNIAKLYTYIHCGTFDVNEVNAILEKVTDDEIMVNARVQHPFLHELCHQIHVSFSLIKVVWASNVFKNYWENANYRDKYGNTALQRLSLKVDCLKVNDQEWILQNMRVVKGKEVRSWYGSSKVVDYLVQE